MFVILNHLLLNTDHIVRAQFTPGTVPQLRLHLTEMEPAGYGPEGTMAQVRIAFEGEEAAAAWLAFRDGVSDAAANLRSVRRDCPHDWRPSEGRAAVCARCYAHTGAAAVAS